MFIGPGAVNTGIDPIKALFWSAVINGTVSVPVMVMMMIMASDKRVMGDFVLSRVVQSVGWFATDVMFLAGTGMLASLIKP
jgi:Mn2+/Fe2+ NRAMP family transporter